MYRTLQNMKFFNSISDVQEIQLPHVVKISTQNQRCCKCVNQKSDFLENSSILNLIFFKKKVTKSDFVGGSLLRKQVF